MGAETGKALVCSTKSRDVLGLTLEIDEDGVLEVCRFVCFGSPDAQDIVDRASIVEGMSIEEAIDCEPGDFIQQEEDIHLGVMVVNAIRKAIMNYAERLSDSSESDETYRPGSTII